MKNKTENADLANTLAIALADNGHDLAALIQQQLLHYLQLMARWNQTFNLTAIRDFNEMVWLHVVDSLAISPYLHGTRIIDVGSGAGLPGIPLALAHPDKKIVLLDSNSKKTRFLTQVKLELNINNIEIVHSRSEDFNPATGFDSVVSRAFASIPVMLAKTGHLAAKAGQFIAMKGVYPEVEIQQLPVGFKVIATHKLVIKGLAAVRHVVCIQKS
jgi:16S rRNA (guanine527-N7)-methyltransferase